MVSLLCQSSVKYFSVEKKRICSRMVYHVDCKNFWESGNFQEETGPIPSQHACRQCSGVWDPHLQSSPGSHLDTSPGELRWIRGSQAWGPAALLGCPRSLERQPGAVVKETHLLHTPTPLKSRKPTYFENSEQEPCHGQLCF